jgi:hypothetical protein
MAVQAKHHKGGKIKGAGEGPNTGAPGPTPAPTRPALHDLISAPRGPGAIAGYGQSGGANNPSSIPPGTRVVSPLAANLESSIDDDGVQTAVIANGTARNSARVTNQLRDIASRNVPDHPRMSGPSKGGTVPATIGTTSAPVVRKPTQ